MLRPTKRKTQSSTLSSPAFINESNNRESSGLVGTTAGTTSALTSNNLRNGSTMSATTSSEETDDGLGSVDDPRKPLFGTTSTGVRDTKGQAKNRIVNDGYNATRITKSISSLRGERDEGEQDNDDIIEENEVEEHMMENISRKSQWILLAVASGACAAFNGVFAKL